MATHRTQAGGKGLAAGSEHLHRREGGVGGGGFRAVQDTRNRRHLPCNAATRVRGNPGALN